MSTFSILRDTFTLLVPEMTRMASAAFRHLDQEAKEECVQNSLALTWHAYHALIEQGRDVEPGLIKSVLWFSVKQTRAGRTVPSGEFTKPKCVFDYAKKGHAKIERIDLRHFVADKTPVPDAVAFRVDVPDFFATLSDRQRRMAGDLIAGETTSAVATKFGITPGAVSQFRTRFKELFDVFMAG